LAQEDVVDFCFADCIHLHFSEWDLSKLAMKDHDRDYRSLLGKRVMVRSHRVTDKAGIVKSYMAHGHHYWVWLDEAIKTRSGKMSQWHKCNADNCRLEKE
jgi:hypothetical protein